ncbi:hypothetical protein L4D06_23825 [Enterovibrio makurazakiensis]|uniref:hypothetical protein n=1 Tax=Enterovibrio makurazakiensis TaxID=2910232 RepID=UPI003D1D8DFB
MMRTFADKPQSTKLAKPLKSHGPLHFQRGVNERQHSYSFPLRAVGGQALEWLSQNNILGRQTQGAQGGDGVPPTQQASRMSVMSRIGPPAFLLRPPAWLPPDTPAWADRGKVGLSPMFFQAERSTQADILRHEYLHAIHQRHAPMDNSAAARRHAEELASTAHHTPMSAFYAPVPTLLAYPAQQHKPWDDVYIGHQVIVGELRSGDLVLRIMMNYSEFKVEDVLTYNENLGLELTEVTKSKVYHCGKHPNPNLVGTVKKLREVMVTVEKLNSNIPDTSTFKIKYIFIAPDVSDRFRTMDKKGVLFLSSNALSTDIVDVAAHEASHGIFEHHATARHDDPAQRVPDNLILQVADIYIKLRNTKPADLPQKKFDPKSPPPYESSESGIDRRASGIIPVHDTVWSGAGGHPWKGIDEFFASAYAAFTQDPKLLDKIVSHYNKHDPNIRALYRQLFTLFKMIGNPKAIASLSAPSDTTGAEKVTNATSAPPDYTDPASRLISDQYLFDPTALPGPDKIVC